MDVLYDLRDRNQPKVVLVKDGAVTRHPKVFREIGKTLNRKRACTIPKALEEEIYALVDQRLQDGTAFRTTPTNQRIPIKELEANDFANFIYNDTPLGINIRDYKEALKARGIEHHHIEFDEERQVRSYSAPQVTRLLMQGRIGDFNVSCRIGSMFEDPAFCAQLLRINT